MVSTTVRLPRSAARTARAAAVVVLPTPPDPQHTITPAVSSSRSTSQPCSAIGQTLGPQRLRDAVETSEIDGLGQ
jgi:hypothetical protein